MSLKETENILNGLASAIEEVLNGDGPKLTGFALIIFEFNTPGIANYVSNAEREDMIKALEETVQRLKNKEDIPSIQGHA